jgi:pimeloyl-ACP methyl ester carboxylesterase
MHRARRLLGLGAAVVSGVAAYKAAQAAYLEYRSAVPRRRPIAALRQGELPGMFDDAVFRTKSGSRICGWWSPGTSGAAVVLVHGSCGDRRSLFAEARALAGHGYSVLLYDAPGHGESDGKPDWQRDAPEALEAAVDWLSVRPGIDARRIGALGSSMGASTVAAVASRDHRIAAVVLEGCFTDAYAQCRAEYAKWGPIQQIPALLVMRAFGIRSGDLRPVDQVSNISPRPLLVIAGSADHVVPVDMARELYAAAREPKQLFIVEGAGHGGYDRVQPDEFPRRLVRFFHDAFGVHGR